MSKIKFPKDISFTGERYGLKFIDGVAETKDSFIIAHLKAKGFIAEGGTKEPTEKEKLIEQLKSLGVDVKTNDTVNQLKEKLTAYQSEQERIGLFQLAVEKELDPKQDATIEELKALIEGK
ncbi:hypothetical protein LJC02_01875 [Breznakia sp. OttesenSCG-928-G09]|nr:hypothetical protein [Breznakia sp. OttesenSCG-928-G09]